MARYNTNRPVWPQKCKFNWNSELSRRGADGGGGEGRVKYVAILHMIRKPNSIIVLLFIQNNS